MLGFLIGSRQTSKPALKLWEVGEMSKVGKRDWTLEERQVTSGKAR